MNSMKKLLITASFMGALLYLNGCASSTPLAASEPLGPAPSPTGRLEHNGPGTLVVYSGQEPTYLDINLEEWLWEEDPGKNAFLYYPAHSDYAIYNQDGTLLKRIHNARNQDDPQPAAVTLPPGQYEIQAQAQDDTGTYPVKVPVIIRAGQTTAVHLAGDWRPRRAFSDTLVARLPDGQIAGWLARP